MDLPSLAFCSVPRPLVSVPLSSSNSTFFANNFTVTLWKKPNAGIHSSSALGRSRTWAPKPRRPLTCYALFGLGVPELVVIAGVAALVFGPKNLPEVGRSIGKTVKSFQQAAKEFESELKKEPDSGEVPPNPTEKPAPLNEQEKQDVKLPRSNDTV